VTKHLKRSTSRRKDLFYGSKDLDSDHLAPLLLYLCVVKQNDIEGRECVEHSLPSYWMGDREKWMD
jgi:hypothetical protein